MLAIKIMQGLGSRLLPVNDISPPDPHLISESCFSLFFFGTAPSGQFVVGLVLTIVVQFHSCVCVCVCVYSLNIYSLHIYIQILSP